MNAFANTALARLGAGEPVAALWLSLGSPALAEIAAEAGPHAIVFDCQHGAWDRAALFAAIGAAKTATPLVRVAGSSRELIGEALDAGAQGVIVPLVEDAATAAAAVAAAHYPPHGYRSGGGMRPLRAFGKYVAAAATQTLVAVMIETRAGLDRVAEIAATPGVGLVFIGPGDLGLSIGAEALERAIAAIFSASRAAGVACGIFTGGAEAAAARLAQGFMFVTADDDISLARGGFARSLAYVKVSP